MRLLNFIGYQPLLRIVLCLLSILCVCVVDGNIQQISAASDVSPSWIHYSFTGIPAESTQFLLVTGESPPSVFVRIYAFERQKSEWVQSLPPIEAIIGAKGFAEPGAKREGDGKTPTGIFPLEFVFGYDETVNTRMPYRRSTKDDIWVDDARSDDYNRWVRRKETRAASFEDMKRKDDLYKYGIVVGYNTQPVIKGNGSAIFLHIRAENNVPTSGCVAMAEDDLVRIIGWLDPVQKPLILMGYEKGLRRLHRR